MPFTRFALLGASLLASSDSARLQRNSWRAPPSLLSEEIAKAETVEADTTSCANYRRIEDGTCAEACIPRFVGVCPRSLVVSAGSLEAGVCSAAGYTVPGEDMEQQAGPCGLLVFKTYTNPLALTQVDRSVKSGCANYRRIEDGTCAEACIPSFVGVCPRSLVVSAGSLSAGVCSSAGYTARGEDMEQQAGPCGLLVFKTYTNPSALVQVDTSVKSGCANYRRIEDGTCAEACIPSFVGVCPRSLVVSAGSLSAGVCSSAGYTVRGEDLEQQAGPCGLLVFKTYT